METLGSRRRPQQTGLPGVSEGVQAAASVTEEACLVVVVETQGMRRRLWRDQQDSKGVCAHKQTVRGAVGVCRSQ